MHVAGAAQVFAFLFIPGRNDGLFPPDGQGERERNSRVELKVRERGTCTRTGCLYSIWVVQIVRALPCVGHGASMNGK